MGWTLLLCIIAPIAAQQVPLTELGPIAVAADGSLHRVANWHDLTENERAAAHRALAKRNAKRLAKLEQARPPSRPPQPPPSASRWLADGARWLRRQWVRRRLAPLDFAPEYVGLIRSAEKRATTRLCSRDGEPQLARLRAGQRVRATCGRCGGAASVAFAVLAITRVDRSDFGALDAQLAATEGFENVEAFQAALLGFYPSLRNESALAVLHFELLWAEQARGGLAGDESSSTSTSSTSAGPSGRGLPHT